MSVILHLSSCDIDALAALIKGCYDRNDDLARWVIRWLDGFLGAEVSEDCLVVNPEVWYADDGNWEIECVGATNAKEAAEQYVDEGDWGDPDNSTSWISASGYRKGISYKGEIERVDFESHSIEIPPEEPECCDEDGHDWRSPYRIVGGIKENPGVWGNGGGVIINECCLRCGCRMQTDTWAQDPSTGEQGLRSVSYEEEYYAEELSRIARKEGESFGEWLAQDESMEEWDESKVDWNGLDSILQGRFLSEAKEWTEETFRRER